MRSVRGDKRREEKRNSEKKVQRRGWDEDKQSKVQRVRMGRRRRRTMDRTRGGEEKRRAECRRQKVGGEERGPGATGETGTNGNTDNEAVKEGTRETQGETTENLKETSEHEKRGGRTKTKKVVNMEDQKRRTREKGRWSGDNIEKPTRSSGISGWTRENRGEKRENNREKRRETDNIKKQ